MKRAASGHRHDGQLRIHRQAGREDRAVGDVEALVSAHGQIEVQWELLGVHAEAAGTKRVERRDLQVEGLDLGFADQLGHIGAGFDRR